MRTQYINNVCRIHNQQCGGKKFLNMEEHKPSASKTFVRQSRQVVILIQSCVKVRCE